MKKVLTIAGSDPIGGAGFQADIKTMTAHDVYGMTAITLLSVQNSMSFKELKPVESEFLASQIDAIFEDVIPDSVKTGMIPSVELVNVVAEKLKKFRPLNILIDPVMVAHRTVRLVKDDVVEAIINNLIPLADIITPNLGEGELITGKKIETESDMIEAAKMMYERFNCSVLLKGGISADNSNDLLYYEGKYQWIKSPKVDTNDTRGTGCSLSAAIASNLAKGQDVLTAVTNAKDYIYNGLNSKIKVVTGRGPIHHSHNITK